MEIQLVSALPVIIAALLLALRLVQRRENSNPALAPIRSGTQSWRRGRGR
jgi:hypothetical protein